MKALKNVFSQLHRFVLWLIVSAVFWGWIFGFLTDTKSENKVTLFIDAYSCDEKALDLRLEEALPEGIKMIRAHLFTYTMFDESALTGADLFIVRASQAEEYADLFYDAPGVKVYDAESGLGAAADLIGYRVPGAAAEDYYLFYGAKSGHIAPLSGEGDGAALAVAETFLSLGGDGT